MGGYVCSLPFEVLSLILDHINSLGDLYECALVNRDMYTKTIPFLWKQPQQNGAKGGSLLNCLLTHHRSLPMGDYIRKLDLDTSFDSPHTMMTLLRHTPNLEKLSIHSNLPTINEDWVESIWPLCPRLNSVRLEHIPISNLSSLIHHCPGMNHLALNLNKSLSPNALQPLIGSQLTSLILDVCTWITDDETPLHISQLLYLKELQIHNYSNVNNQFIRRLIPINQVFEQLTVFKVSTPDPFEATVVMLLMQSLPLLQSITVPLLDVNQTFFLALSSVPRLQYVNLLGKNYSVRSQNVRQLVKDCPRLTRLILRGNCWLPNRCFPEIHRLYSAGFFSLNEHDIKSIRLRPDPQFTPDYDIIRPSDKEAWDVCPC